MINKFKNKGFTILESIVAIGILSLSIAGAFSAVQQSLSSSIISKQEVQAFYLAQEAVEVIRNKRDANQKAKMNNPLVTWLTGIAENSDDPCYFGKTCRVDARSFSFNDCALDSGGKCIPLKQESSSDSEPYMYNYSIGNDTLFEREIQIEQINADEIAVVVRIIWKKGIIDNKFEAKTLLFNWI